MDSAASTTTTQSRTLDESGHKLGGNIGENLGSQGKGSSSNRHEPASSLDTRMLSDKAASRLKAISRASAKGLGVKDLFRLMSDPSIWMQAFSNIYPNRGAVTKGVSNNTLDGFSEDRALNLIETLKEGLFQHQPVRRTYIPKSHGKLRPLGIPTGDDKLVQEVARIVLNSVYEPLFTEDNHGFRHGRSCHSALRSIHRNWSGVKWIINVDIEGYFNNIHHEVLVKLLEKRIDDKRFIKLIKLMLKAGYVEKWTFHNTYSGTPQGGVISPLLSNIYLHEMDMYMKSMKTGFNKGKRRKPQKDYHSMSGMIYRQRLALDKYASSNEADRSIIREQKDHIDALINERRKFKSRDPFDSGYRRLLYCRYADDFVVGIIGSKAEAEWIYERMKSFLEKTLKLNISDRKSGISHFGKGFRYLGYGILSVSLDKIVRTVKSGRHTTVKSIAEIVTLRVPYDKGINFAKAHGYVSPDLKSYRSRPELLYRSDAEIITIYNSELRGLCNYYTLAGDVKIKLHRLEHIWKGSLLATLAAKHKSSITQVAKSILNGEYLYRMKVNGKERTLKCFSLKDIPKIKPNWSAGVDEIKNLNNVKHFSFR
jgi:group II intron reverse transcriptase/maturase